MSVEVDVFYERKRKELLTSTTEASRKVEGDRHTRGQSIADSKVHVQVICYVKTWICMNVCVQLHFQLYYRRKEIDT